MNNGIHKKSKWVYIRINVFQQFHDYFNFNFKSKVNKFCPRLANHLLKPISRILFCSLFFFALRSQQSVSVSDFHIQNYLLEPPPLPATLPPVGSQIKHTRISTTTVSYSNIGSNTNNNSDEAAESLSWHSQSQSLGSNNSKENVLSSQSLANNNFLDNERAASVIAAG